MGKRKLKKRKLNKKRFLLFLMFVIGIICIISILKNNITDSFNLSPNLDFDISQSTKNLDYSIIAQSTNNNYLGIGQEKVKNKDGYFTTFTTIKDNKKIYKEYKQNGTASWSNHSYWGDTMEKNGCGITAISTILSGYGKNYTPEDLRNKYYPVLDNDTISQELTNTFGLENSDFYYDSTHLSETNIKEHLETNRPILICVWTNPSSNRWTTSSHYMALLATDGKNMVYISNPNGLENDSKSSGWYEFDEVVPFIAKALYIESY